MGSATHGGCWFARVFLPIGLCRSRIPAKVAERMLSTTRALIRELETRSAQISAMGLAAKLPDATLTGKLLNLANTPADLDRVTRAIETLVGKAGLSLADAETAVRQLINERHFYGSYCELGAYDWLDRQNVAFAAQIQLGSSDVLNPNGCTVDGRFTIRDGYFDIKALGFQAYVADQFRVALKAQLPGFDVIIDGPMDISVKNIETIAFPRLAKLRADLANGGIQKIPELGWTIRAQRPQRITMSTHTVDPYRLAEENRYYPFKTAGQFARNEPFVLIFAYAAQFNHAFFLNFGRSTETTIRSMARRAFFQLTTDPSPAGTYDDQIAPGLTIADAAKQISGLLFINLDKDEAWLFLNPRANHRLMKDHVEEIFDFRLPVALGIDDFAYDNY
jgi:hypothetical protein